ncbi:MAG: hypothetical protein FWG40_07675 [Peptococcaceae bacterium]|nr:hypothetical protein [Peptococcaceae bacterium]
MSDTNAPQGYTNPNDAENNKLYAILAYIGFLFIVPLAAAPQSPFAKFHANQGLILFIVEISLSILSVIFSWIPILGFIVSILCFFGAIGCLILAILGIVNAANGKTEPLPLIGGFTLIK